MNSFKFKLTQVDRQHPDDWKFNGLIQFIEVDARNYQDAIEVLKVEMNKPKYSQLNTQQYKVKFILNSIDGLHPKEFYKKNKDPMTNPKYREYNDLCTKWFNDRVKDLIESGQIKDLTAYFVPGRFQGIHVQFNCTAGKVTMTYEDCDVFSDLSGNMVNDQVPEVIRQRLGSLRDSYYDFSRQYFARKERIRYGCYCLTVQRDKVINGHPSVPTDLKDYTCYVAEKYRSEYDRLGIPTSKIKCSNEIWEIINGINIQ